jgi:hypothetical protein
VIRFPRLALCLTLVVLAGTGVSYAQPPAPAAPAPPPPPAPAPASTPLAAEIGRWLDVQSILLQTRYHFIASATSAPDINQMQTWDTLRARIKADPAGRIAVSVGWLSGPSFIGSWNDSGIGTGTTRLHTSLRLLSLDVTPIKGVVVQAGSVQLLRGESTEFTTYDNDGYLTGERITIHRPKDLFFDEVSVARGYLGDANRPSVFDRTRRLKEANYRQYLLTKHVARHVWTSADLTRYNEATIIHAAARVQLPTLRVIDNVRYEQYVRDAKTETVAGFTATAEKQLTRPLLIAGGYGDIDKNYGGLNADRFNRGRRLYALATYTLSPVLSLSTYLGRAVHNDYPVTNHTRFDVTLSYNLLAQLQRSGILPK